MKLGIYEILDKISKFRTTQQKIDFLRENDSITLRVILKAAFDPKVKWLLPEGEPPYTPNALVDQQNVLYREYNQLQYFIEGYSPTPLPMAKRESLFIQLLEKVDKDDAKVLCSIKEKKLPTGRITAQHVREAFPGLLS